MGVNIIPREEWGSWDPWSRSPRHPPADTVLWSYTETDACTTIFQCRDYMQQIQRQHIRLHKLEDVPYNFVVGGDGNVYEGRGWLLSPQLGSEEERHKGTNLYIGISGRPTTSIDGDGRSEALDDLIRFGVNYKLITEDFIKVNLPKFTPKNNDSEMGRSIKFHLDDMLS
ncbi:peptidoglycan-recognition protein SB2-like [Macrosteles quadrilineatus]|uniref:peptidoglycan-recognition protein SB2-like n=1 Tax=Macrosteles quadrilineatus TaxID=74068 RepID=UPI0023E23AA0|nr:peptidoglycan-recognition protein SB2-like [Macrosteles quadrilineatus]XP_054264904.1 peptidoglycan-recognition protein SB2-like [Macrosteles quadrilineatus]XP_054264905.1 peptidoglycan-recognition protein SB2-like [Macrosteles quadrilineatus]